jgi:hypothetical protein
VGNYKMFVKEISKNLNKCDRIYVDHTFHKRLISKIYNRISKFNIKIENHKVTRKWTKIMKRHFTEGDVWVARCLLSLTIRKMQ